ncbi:hypothetical protein SUGI_0735800 [Cryptomeria japonica]|nr:hypothetical protein SUGI_0735800 [Cryptomeria japonica]
MIYTLLGNIIRAFYGRNTVTIYIAMHDDNAMTAQVVESTSKCFDGEDSSQMTQIIARAGILAVQGDIPMVWGIYS